MRPKQVIIFGASGILLVALVLVALLAYPILTSGTMRFLIPENFRGFMVLKEGANGQSSGEWFEVPKDGVVVVDSVRLFLDYYQVEAKWMGGDSIEVVSLGRDNDHEGVGFWTLPLPAEGGRFFFFVGDFGELRKQWDESRRCLYGVR